MSTTPRKISMNEREANAKLCKITCCKCMDTAKSIRQRGKK
jgi:hypothetical protein